MKCASTSSILGWSFFIIIIFVGNTFREKEI